MDNRLAISPNEAKQMDTAALRKAFLIDKIFEADTAQFTLSHYDRYIAGGVMPVTKAVALPNPEKLKAQFFLERREMGIINVGGKGTITADGQTYELDYKEALYIGKGTKDVQFTSADGKQPAKFYINAAPAHHTYPTKKISKANAEVVELAV
jgi:4-deoxy-L-threo-5-hexosulose-uronate ketol-isomerase